MELLYNHTGTGQAKAGTWIGSISLDASISEVHNLSATVTQHPLESGESVGDNVRQNPIMVRIEGFVSNQPIIVPGSQVDGVTELQREFEWIAQPDVPIIQVGGPGIVGAATGAISSAIGADVHKGSAKGFSLYFDRVQDVYEEFIAIWTARTLIDIVTTLHIYNNMVIESLDITRDASTGNALPFTATATQVRIVTTNWSSALAKPATERAKSETSAGKQPGSSLADDAAGAAGGKSVAASIADSLTGGF